MKSFRSRFKGKSEGELIEGAFDFVLFCKTAFALVEVLSGFSLFFVSPTWVKQIIAHLTDSTLDKNPASPLANFLVSLGQHFTVSTGILVAVYLLVHGLIKLITLVLLWKKVLWAYPLSILVFIGFIVYQMYEFAMRQSIFMIAVSLFDILLVALTWLEWRRMSGKLKHANKRLGIEDENLMEN
ncbi:MAG: DUF2127 domain-containing protein [Streptococcaceae bacterium]|jgi:uncharacterized membrane protein|nr:DUF2127 domain-containing protein [Streptococcaceae bacterium]